MRDEEIAIRNTVYGSVAIAKSALVSFLRCITGRRVRDISVSGNDGRFDIRGKIVIPPGKDAQAVLSAFYREIPETFEKLGLYVSSLHIEVEKKKNVFQIG